MRTLTVLWLHSPDDGEGDLLSVVEHGLSDAFRDFCSEAFNVRMPLEYPPLKLTTVHSPEELPDALFIGGDPSRGMTEGGDDACLFMVDDSFYSGMVRGMPLKDWLKTYIPALPKVAVVYPGRPPIVVPQRRWAKKGLEVLSRPEADTDEEIIADTDEEAARTEEDDE